MMFKAVSLCMILCLVRCHAFHGDFQNCRASNKVVSISSLHQASRFTVLYNSQRRGDKGSSSKSYQFLATGDDEEITLYTRFLRIPILQRSHEKIVAIIFSGISSAILYSAGIHREKFGLPISEPGKWLVMAETSLALTWSSMVLAISFLEAWTKFRAPFLKKYIAVDVGRHVFATLNAAESGIVASFWLHRLFQCYQVQKVLGGALMYKTRAYYEQFTFTLPAVASVSLILQMLVIAPKLYRRAKSKILDGFDQALPSVKITMTVAERKALSEIAQDLGHVKRLPSRVWHSLYALLEMVKIGCLNAFVVLSWLKLLGTVNVN